MRRYRTLQGDADRGKFSRHSESPGEAKHGELRNSRSADVLQLESDGSFYLHVPSERPIRIELADRAGRVLAGEKGWFWMRRGEQRVCVGCHAGPERAPENVVPMALLRSTVPAEIPAPEGEK